MTEIDDTELLSAHPGFSAIEDGIGRLEGDGYNAVVAAIRLLDQQNDARGREIDRLKAATPNRLADAADALAATARDLQAHIEARAEEIAQQRIREALSDSQLLVKQLEGDLASERVHREDLAAEFRRQLAARNRQNEQQAARIAELKGTADRAWNAPWHTDKQDRTFVYREDLYAALNPERAPVPVTTDNEGA